MRKIYKSGTCLSLNVSLGGGKNARVSFNCHSDGSSSFITDDALLQKGLESHYMFGSMFRLEDAVDLSERCVQLSESEVDDAESPSMLEVSVTDLSDAKNYLAEHFGVSRTQLRSRSSIVEHGAIHGVVFTGI